MLSRFGFRLANRSERSEEAHDKLREASAFPALKKQILRYAQDDIT